MLCGGVALSSEAQLTHIAAPTCSEKEKNCQTPAADKECPKSSANKVGMNQRAHCESLKDLTVPHQVNMKWFQASTMKLVTKQTELLYI